LKITLRDHLNPACLKQ